jgi:hypothetical protein
LSDLARFQDRFAASLTGPPSPDAPIGLAVYRNTFAQGLIDALAGNFPTVRRLMGEAWFAEVALAYARANPPTAP